MSSLLVALALLTSSPPVDVARIPLAELKTRADAGEPLAMAELGARHLRGLRGAVRRHSEGRRWCEAARAAVATSKAGAVNGRAEACLNLSSGPETPCELLIARGEAAAATGDAHAMFALAKLLGLLAQPTGASVNAQAARIGRACAIPEAVRPAPAGKARIVQLLTASARLGHPEAEAVLALTTATGADDAIETMEALVAQGNVDAASLLGTGMLQSANAERKRRAVELLTLAASAGDSHAIGVLLDCHGGGFCDKDDAARKAVFERGLALGDPRCIVALAVAKASGEGQSVDAAGAVALAEPIVFDEPGAATLAARGFCYGVGTAKDDERCLVANLGRAHFDDPDGIFDLAVNTINGQGRTADAAEAARLYERASKLGHARAANNLGLMYQKGEGVPLDPSRAFEWYTLAAERNDPEGWNNVGAMLARGLQGEPDLEGAVVAWRKGADLGGVWAMGNLATALAKGRGVTRDIDSAVVWYRKAADAGHAPAAARLAETLLSGEVPRDLAAAVRWAQLAAQQGDRHGCALMAQLHFWGWGVARDSRLMAGYLDCGAGLAEADVIRAEAVVRSGDGAQGRSALEDAAARGLAEARLTLVRLALEPDLAASLRGEAPAQDLEAARKWLGDGAAVTGDEADAYRAVLSLAGGAKEESIATLERIAARSPLAGVLAALAILSLPAPDRTLAERLLRTGSDAQIGYADEVLAALKKGAPRAPASTESEALFVESEQAFAAGSDGRATLEAASRSGFGPATCRLGWRLALGAGVDPDQARGLTLLSQDCDPLVLAEAQLLGTPDEKARAEAMLRDRAASGDVRAAILLGRAYVEGRLVPADPNAATVLLERANAKDDADGRAWLGRAMLELNREAGIAHLRAAEKAGSCDAVVLRSLALDAADDPESPGGKDRLAACAKAGHAASAYLVGRAFWFSDDPPTRDFGRRLMRIASNAGHAEATYNLAVGFREGAAGEPRDPEFAVRLFERALAGGYGDAAYSLGRLHALGEGVPKDPEKALAMFRRCADVRAECAGSVAHILLARSGEGTPRFDEGVAMLERASAMGDEGASARLALLLAEGAGVTTDVPRATALLVDAANRGVSGSYAALVYIARQVEVRCEGKPLQTWLEEKATSGHTEAAKGLGMWLVAQERPKEALRYLAVAATEGHFDAERAFAAALHGRQPPMGPSLDALEAAVAKGDAEAMLELHRRLAGEFNADVDRVKALLTQAAERGYAPAINTLAVFVREGDFTDPADPQRACGLFAKAAELGDGKALFSWADCRARGVGGPLATAEEVASILRRASLAGSVGAQLTYGLARIKGELGPADPAEGRTFLEMAASAGRVDAMLHLATLAEFGMVDGKDLAAALAWLQLAEELSYGEERTQIQARIAAASQALDPKGRARATKLVDGHRASLRKRWPMPK